jgi:hypothetical protein
VTRTTPPINRGRAFSLLAVAYFMTIIDLTIVNVSLPTIGHDLHFTQTNLQWVATAYAWPQACPDVAHPGARSASRCPPAAGCVAATLPLPLRSRASG